MWKTLAFSLAALLGLTTTASAHFGTIIPSSSMVTDKKDAAITLDAAFIHPMEMRGMDLSKPEAFRVLYGETSENLESALRAATFDKQQSWKAGYVIRRPGVYQFVMEPKPYWEEAEDCFIIHYTKTYVAAFGDEEGWDAPAGLKTEIVPLTRPFGNYAGNVFRGRVLLNGKPVPGAEVEVEYYNKDKQYVAPNPYMVTQTIKADKDGVFAYSVPFAGWWGFAALTTAEETLDHEGSPKPVELGAVLWTEFLEPQRAASAR